MKNLNFLLKEFLFLNRLKNIEIGIEIVKKNIEYPPYLNVGCLENHIRNIINIKVQKKVTFVLNSKLLFLFNLNFLNNKNITINEEINIAI